MHLALSCSWAQTQRAAATGALAERRARFGSRGRGTLTLYHVDTARLGRISRIRGHYSRKCGRCSPLASFSSLVASLEDAGIRVRDCLSQFDVCPSYTAKSGPHVLRGLETWQSQTR